jgi:hypothetical protein
VEAGVSSTFIPRRSTSGKAPSVRRKNLLLEQAKIDRARQIVKTSTETEAIHRALDAAADLEAFQRELDPGFDALIGAGGFSDRFAG